MNKTRFAIPLFALMGAFLFLAGCGEQSPAVLGTTENTTSANVQDGGAGATPTSVAAVFFGLLEEASAAAANGDFDAALDAYNRALVVAENADDRAGQSSVYRRIGIVYYRQNQTEKALEHYGRAAVIAREINSSALEGNAIRNSGIVYFDQGDYGKAIELYTEALVAAQQPDARERDPNLEGDVLFSLGKAFHLNGDLTLALQNYERAASIYRQLGNQPLHGSVLRNIGIVYDMQGYNEAALTYYEQAIEIARQIEDADFERDLQERIQGLSE